MSAVGTASPVCLASWPTNGELLIIGLDQALQKQEGSVLALLLQREVLGEWVVAVNSLHGQMDNFNRIQICHQKYCNVHQTLLKLSLGLAHHYSSRAYSSFLFWVF